MPTAKEVECQGGRAFGKEASEFKKRKISIEAHRFGNADERID